MLNLVELEFIYLDFEIQQCPIAFTAGWQNTLILTKIIKKIWLAMQILLRKSKGLKKNWQWLNRSVIC